MHTNLAKDIYRKRIVIEGKYNLPLVDLTFVYNFLLRLTKQVKEESPRIQGMHGPFVHDYTYDKEVDKDSSFEGSVIWNEHEARLYMWHEHTFFTLDIYTCSPFEVDGIIDFLSDTFKTEDIAWHEMPQPSPFEESTLIELRESTSAVGSGGFCKRVYSKRNIFDLS
jgi:S-adenosylmethionine/arginine decarboxylase-like enzyme